MGRVGKRGAGRMGWGGGGGLGGAQIRRSETLPASTASFRSRVKTSRAQDLKSCVTAASFDSCVKKPLARRRGSAARTARAPTLTYPHPITNPPPKELVTLRRLDGPH